MKKTILFLVFTFCFTYLIGCTKETGSEKQLSKDHKQYEYTGGTLKVAVVGNEKNLAEFKNVSYHPKKLGELVNEKEPFDALIVTEEGFEEADKEKYVIFFNEINYPVFFYGITGISDSAFLEKNRTIEQAKINSKTYIKGYVNESSSRIMWNIHLPNNPTEKDKNEGMLVKIFEKADETRSK